MTQKQIFDLPIGAGQYTEQSERGAVGRWYSMDKVRFRKGLAEKIGGWDRIEPQFVGTCRNLKDWTSLDAKHWAAVATDIKLYVWQDNTLYDITPIRRTETLAAPFETFTGETRVRVTDTGHGASAGDYVTFSNTIVGGASGITVDGEYVVNTIIDPDNYEITDDQTAGTGGAGEGGTAVVAEYQLSAGATTAVAARGYGTGPYGREGYGDARTGSTLVLPIRTWALDQWGEDLLASPRSGAIYWWDRSKGTGTRAEALGGDAPPNNEHMIVSQRDRHLIALGAFDYFNNVFDPMLIRWSSTEDLNDWVPTSTNTSGDLRLYSGSRIVTGVRSRLETVVFTDVSVHTLPFFGGFDVFGLNTVGENVSILGPNAAVPIDSRVIFMAESDFYIYDGIVKVLNCDVRNFVYDNINVDQRDKVYGGLNREFNEVWFFYPSYDPMTWVQTDFTLRLPPGYQKAASAPAPASLFGDVVFQADFEGADNSQVYTEESQFAEDATFFNTAKLEATGAIFGSTSLYVDGNDDPGTYVRFPIQTANKPAWDGTGKYMTAEFAFDSSSLPSSTIDDRTVIVVGDSDFQLLRFRIEWSSGNGIFFRAGFANSGGILNVEPDILANTDYFVVIEADYTAGAGNGVERVWLGTVASGEATLISTVSSLTAKNPASLTTEFIHVGKDAASGGKTFTGEIDHMRVTVSDTARYGTATTITIPATYATAPGGGATDVGYNYSFSSGGFTDVAATADNNYEHDYFLINDEPILTPLESEYGVEMDVNPAIGANVGRAGLSFLRTDLIGTPETDADDAQQLMFTLNFAGQTAEFWKKTVAGVAAPVNLGANTVDFTTLTGAAMVTGQKYILTVQFDTPQVTAWVDGIQAFQFDLDATELTQFVSGSMGLHQTPGTANDLYRFYNLAAGPLGTVTAADFDISPIETNRYVIYNYEEGSWATGKMSRTAWADRSPLLEKPYAAATDGYLYQHETGTDNNGAAMPSYIESFDLEIPSAGEELMHVDQLIPDFLTLEGDVTVNLTGRKYPHADRISKGPYVVSATTRKVSTRIRARQIAIKVSSSNTGDKWRMGAWRGRAGPHGKRG